MSARKPVIIHKLPLTVVILQHGIDLTCEVPEVKHKRVGDELQLSHETPAPPGAQHLFCYTVAAPMPSRGQVHYLTVFSGPSLGELKPWVTKSGVLQSPAFDMTAGEHAMYVSLVLLSEPLAAVHDVPDRDVVNSPRDLDDIAAPTVRACRRHVSTDFKGGGE